MHIGYKCVHNWLKIKLSSHPTFYRYESVYSTEILFILVKTINATITLSLRKSKFRPMKDTGAKRDVWQVPSHPGRVGAHGLVGRGGGCSQPFIR